MRRPGPCASSLCRQVLEGWAGGAFVGTAASLKGVGSRLLPCVGVATGSCLKWRALCSNRKLLPQEESMHACDSMRHVGPRPTLIALPSPPSPPPLAAALQLFVQPARLGALHPAPPRLRPHRPPNRADCGGRVPHGRLHSAGCSAGAALAGAAPLADAQGVGRGAGTGEQQEGCLSTL